MTNLDTFEIFWKAYPRKVAKQAARRIWVRIKPDAELLEKMLATLDAWRDCEQWIERGRKYCPHPATWLHQERWDDESPCKGTEAKIKLFPITGKMCSERGCYMPAVYKNTSGSYDNYRCTHHLPDKVKLQYE